MIVNPVRGHPEISSKERGYLEKGTTRSDFMAGPAPHVCRDRGVQTLVEVGGGFPKRCSHSCPVPYSLLSLSLTAQLSWKLERCISGAELEREGVW